MRVRDANYSSTESCSTPWKHIMFFVWMESLALANNELLVRRTEVGCPLLCSMRIYISASAALLLDLVILGAN